MRLPDIAPCNLQLTFLEAASFIPYPLIMNNENADRLGIGSQSTKDWITLFEPWQEDDSISAMTNPAIKEVRGHIRELSADEQARQLAEACMKALRDKASLLEDAEQRGLETGRIEAEARGEARGALAAKREILHSLVQLKFVTSTQDIEARLNETARAQLDHWIKGVFTASTLEELFVN